VLIASHKTRKLIDRSQTIWYIGSEPQLFNVDADPLENDDLVSKPEYTAKCSELEIALYALAAPAREDARAKANQRVRRLKVRLPN